MVLLEGRGSPRDQRHQTVLNVVDSNGYNQDFFTDSRSPPRSLCTYTIFVLMDLRGGIKVDVGKYLSTYPVDTCVLSVQGNQRPRLPWAQFPLCSVTSARQLATPLRVQCESFRNLSFKVLLLERLLLENVSLLTKSCARTGISRNAGFPLRLRILYVSMTSPLPFKLQTALHCPARHEPARSRLDKLYPHLKRCLWFATKSCLSQVDLAGCSGFELQFGSLFGNPFGQQSLTEPEHIFILSDCHCRSFRIMRQRHT